MTQEQYIDHEVRLRLQEIVYKQLNRKLDIIIAACAAIFTIVLIPVALHAMNLV